MAIKQLYPPIEVRKLPPFEQCCGIVKDESQRLRGWRQNRYGPRGLDPEHCSRKAQYTIDGKLYCGLHAAQIALKRWVEGSLVDKEKR